MIHSYPSIYNLGHAAIADLLNGPVLVEEKIDGSQISFGLDGDGNVQLRSKGAQINVIAPEGMFAEAVKTVQALKPKLTPGLTYRGEYLRSPKHNALAYDRIPAQHIILFDVNPGLEQYLTSDEKCEIAAALGLECVAELFRGIVEDVNQFRALLDTQSVLGGQKIEGVVIKPIGYDQFGRDKKCLMGKFVSEAFREVHAVDPALFGKRHAFQRRRRGAHQKKRAFMPGAPGRDFAGMIARRSLLLVRSFMLFVHDDETEVQDRGKDRRAWPKHDIARAHLDPFPGQEPFAVGHLAVKDLEIIPEMSGKEPFELFSERDLGHKTDCRAALF